MLSVRTFVALGFIYLSLSAGGAQTDPAPEEVVTVPDPRLRAVLEDSLGLSEGAPIPAVALARLTVLEAPDASIVALTGLEWATGLTRLDLGPGPRKWPWENSNAISDLAPLSGLTGLTWLSLSGNAVVNVSPLSGLTGLTYLNLQGNPLSEVSSLSGLTRLTDLYLALTPLTEASSLSGLTGLTVHGLPWPYRYPKLGSLSDRVEAYEDARPTGRSGARSPAPPAPSVRVKIQTDTPARVDAVARFLADQGISADTWQGDSASVIQGLLWARVPVSLLVRLSEQAGVLRIEKVYPSIPLQNNGSSEEDTPASKHGATAWHGAGIEGEGIRVGVIDGGFQDFSTMVDTATVTVMARCHRGEDEDPSSNVSDCANNTDHGTVVTEALLGIAPNVSLYISDTSSPAERNDAVAWMIGEGVQVINFSAGTPWDGPGDGTSMNPRSPLNSVNAAVEAGIIWVNGAGNDAKRTWFSNSEISFIADNNNNFLEFDDDTDATGNEVFLPPGTVHFQLRWKDTWPETASDPGAERNLNLYLYHKPVEYEGGMSMVAQVEYRFKLRAQMDAGLGASTEAVRATPVQPQVAYGASSYEAREGGAAVEVGVALSAQATRAVRLPLTVTADSGTEAGDYTVEGLSAGAAGAYTVSFTLGQSTQTFTLRANADEDEDDETVSLGLGTLPSGVRAGTPASATVTLRDIDVNEPPVITGGPTAVSFAENGTDAVATYRATDPEGPRSRGLNCIWGSRIPLEFLITTKRRTP